MSADRSRAVSALGATLVVAGLVVGAVALVRSNRAPKVDNGSVRGRGCPPGAVERRDKAGDGGDGWSIRDFASLSASVEPIDGSPPHLLCLLVADDDAERAQGLMTITDPDLAGHDGMVFVYPTDHEGAFWMRNTPMPLSIAYLDGTARVVSTADMAPCPDRADCRMYPASSPFRFAIEVPKGRLDDLGLTLGARLVLG